MKLNKKFGLDVLRGIGWFFVYYTPSTILLGANDFSYSETEEVVSFIIVSLCIALAVMTTRVGSRGRTIKKLTKKLKKSRKQLEAREESA